MSTTALLLLTAGSIGVLLLLVIALRMQAFIALLVVSFIAAILGGVPPSAVADAVTEGMGNTLGYIAVVIGVGTMLGEMIQASGGASKIASTIIRVFGERKAQWALALIGIIVATPVFFEVGLIIFIPLVYNLARRTGKSLLYYGIPLVGGMAVAHACIPPTPGPVAVSSIIGADLGWVIFFGVLAGAPAAAIGGVFFGNRIARRIHVAVPETAEHKEDDTEGRKTPSFAMVVALIALPLVLILANTAGKIVLPEGSDLRGWISFIGHPFTALTAALLLAFYFLGIRLGFSADEVQRIATRSMEPVGMIILLTGAGGVFAHILVQTGVGDALTEMMAATQLPILLFGFLIAVVIRVAQGSATMAMVASAGLLAPIIQNGSFSEPMLGAITIAVACGATVLSHVNDSGFWLVNQLMGMTEAQTLRSWTVMATIVGVVGLAVVLLVAGVWL
ncbi:MAG: gluconate transporter [Bacteroidetes bacterium SB0662_bin_6]|nr:gluconate transporter [Bacteroidetes bacterium SB0668_bin_1]MYE05427.1 gluconate transporter [Bacteroidetes bacterium SB0662_bin_6]